MPNVQVLNIQKIRISWIIQKGWQVCLCFECGLKQIQLILTTRLSIRVVFQGIAGDEVYIPQELF